MQYAILRLSKKENHLETFDLKFKLKNNSFVCKWIDCVLEAQQNNYPISEPWAIHNINNYFNKKYIKDNLNRLINEVDKVEKLFGFNLSDIDNQDELNKIHSIFEQHHGKLNEWKVNTLFKNKPDSFRKNLSEINQWIHVCEDQGLMPKIRIVRFDLPKTKKFTVEDYKLFTNKRTFGTIYTLYCDVGKNIEALSEDNDHHHHDVVPNLHYSSDCSIYFHDDDDETVKKAEDRHKNYIENNKEKLKKFTKEELTTGRIELAKLESHLSNEELLEKMKPYNNIQSFFLI